MRAFAPRRRAPRSAWIAVAGAGAVLASTLAAADNPPAPSEATQAPAEPLQEVVVTGTLIRNAAPVGSALIAVDQQQLQETGATSLSDALRTLPLVDNLGVSDASRSGTGGAGNIVYGNSINLRGLSPFATLTLVDGHRVPPGGTSGSTVDPDAFPSLMLSRVDIVADGASATYGSDAIAGVVNLILRRNVEGVAVDGKYGFANGYEENREGLIAGHSWGSGQVSIGFEENYHSDLNGEHRSFFESNQTSEGGTNYDTQQCNPGTIVVGNTTYAIPKGGVTPATAASLIPGTANYCDPAKSSDILPRVRHENLAFTLDQKIGDFVSLFGDATYSKRTFQFLGSAPVGPLEVPASNAYFVAPPGTAPAVETVNYSFANDIGPSRDYGASNNFQGTLGFKVDLTHDWLLTVDGTAGRDRDFVYDPPDALVNGALATALASNNPATALNVYGGANPASVINPIFGGIFYGPGFSREQVIEAQADGGLFALPGGEVRLALGGQWRHDELEYGLFSGEAGAALVIDNHLSRHSDSTFAEILVPIFGPGNAVPGIQRLDLDIAGRYEHYSDFGGTSHPKIGLNWTPADGWMVHASYGTSFRAPLLSELVGPLRGVFVQTYSDPLAANGTSVGYTLGGGNQSLKPETATTFSAGVDFSPTPQSKISLTYYNIDYKNQIGSYLSDLTILQQTNQLGGLVTRCPSAACTALINQYTTGPGALPILGPPLANPSVFVNGLEENLGATKTQGLDLVGSYVLQPVPLPGRWSVDLAANLTTQYDLKFTPTGAYFDVLNTIGYPLRLRMRGDIGWAEGPVTAKFFVNFVNGYTNNETTPAQSVSAYVTEDLDVAFNAGQVWQSPFTQDLTFTFHVTNIGNLTPPYVNIPIGNGGGGYDPTAASPLGRVISVGFGKKF